MITATDIQELKGRIFELVQFYYDGEIKTEHFDGVRVSYKDGVATLGCATRSQLARALFLLALELSEGKKEIDVTQKPCFKELGVMLSVQTPMKVESVINYMEHMAALGYTYILLYMETSYEVKEYPFFGYMRGRYTAEELRKIDEEGKKLGIEVIPCIQTFGHLSDYLRWPAAGPIKDNAECLLADNEETYVFIETLIRTVGEIFKSRRIHIGMDETRGMGLGNYLVHHPYTDRMEIFNRHLKRVKEICKKYGLAPMMWSDMPFRLGGDGVSDEYDEKSVIPESVTEAASGVDMCFWDYYNREYEPYDKTLKRHLHIFRDSKVVFCGGVWVLDNHIMNMPHTLNATIPAMEACIDNQIENVMATIWGNAHNTNLEQSLPGLAAFSEYCYLGRGCTRADIYRAASYLTKLSQTFIEAISEFHLGYKNSLKLGSRLIWCDILYRKMRFTMDYDASKERLEKALSVIVKEAVPTDRELKEYAEKLFRVAIIKCVILKDIQAKYKERDMAFLRKISEELIPELLPLYERISQLKQALWMRGTKPFGIENIQFEYAGIIERLRYAQQRLRQLQFGEITAIEELDEDILEEGYIDWLGNDNHMRA